MIPRARREALVQAARAAGVPLVEDNPYGDLWFDQAPPPAMASWWPEGSVYLGSFSKVLTPGFRLGYIVAPAELMPKLLQAKQASDLHTPSFNQRVVHEVVRNGFLDQHVPTIRARYRAQRDAMEAALRRHMPAGTTWRAPQGGMFFWLRLAEGLDALQLLEHAVAAGVAFVPGAPFYAHAPDPRAMRLSFVTLSPSDIEIGITALGRVLHEALSAVAGGHAMTHTLADLRAAAAIVHAHVPATPQHPWPLLRERCGLQLWVKHENHTPVGAFKLRGGIVYFERLLAGGARPGGVVCATRGNHGQSIALAARQHGLSVTIVVPHGNSREKNAAMRALGATLIEHGDDFQSAREHAQALAAQHGWHMVPSFHVDLVAGVASYCARAVRRRRQARRRGGADRPRLGRLRCDRRA